MSSWVPGSDLCLLIITIVQATTPIRQYDPTTISDSFSSLKLDEAIVPEFDSPSKHTAEMTMSTQSSRRGPPLPVSPSQGLPVRSPPPQDSLYPSPPYDDSASYHNGYEPHLNDDQLGPHAARPYWNDPVAYPSGSYSAIDSSSQHHHSPHSQAYFQQCECLKLTIACSF